VPLPSGRRCLAALVLAVLLPAAAAAQEPSTPQKRLDLPGVRFDQTAGAAQAEQDPARRCEGCPRRSLGRPYLESLALVVLYNGINHARGHETARVGPRSWWANLKSGFEWDTNPWFVNQFGHPYQGSDYFTSGRAHGLSFWEASSVAAFGSATWEYFAENNRASLNDLVNTTLGGITLGEIRHRTAWLIRNPSLEGKGRKKRELIAAAIDPLGFLARTFSGDVNKVSRTPANLIPSRLGTGGAMGVMWQGTSVRDSETQGRPFVDLDLEYGDVRSGASRTPFEAFTLSFSSAGSQLTQAAVRGRLYSRQAFTRLQFSIFQTYDFNVNRAFFFGGQGFEFEVAARFALTPGTTLRMAGTTGANVLGAVDTLIAAPAGVTLSPDLLKRRSYDYGAGGRGGWLIQVLRQRRSLFSLGYHFDQISVVDGARSNHVVQYLYADARLPLGRTLSLGATAATFFRKVYVFPDGLRSDHSPAYRVFLAWDRR
jgi:hypothetical protein